MNRYRSPPGRAQPLETDMPKAPIFVLVPILLAAPAPALVGELDPSFAGDGRQTVAVVAGQQDFTLGMVLQPFDGDEVLVGDTREVVEGENYDDAVVVRLVGDSCSLAAPRQLDAHDVGSEEWFEACEEVAAGNGFRVLGTGDVTFRAGERIVLEDGFELQSGGSFRAVIE